MHTDLVADVKTILANAIIEAKEESGLNGTEFARLAKIGQPDCSKILNGNLDRFAVQRLLTVVQNLGIKIKIETEH